MPPEDEQVEETTEESEETSEEGTDQETDNEAAEWTPPSEADYKKLQGIADKRRAERDRYRRDLAALRKAVKATDGDDSKGDTDHAESDKWRGVAVKKAAAGALKEAGFNGDAKAAKKLIATIDLSQVEPDDDGDIDIDEAIDDLKESFPALFTTKQRTAGRGVSTGHGRDVDQPPQDVTELHSKRLLRMGQSRR